MLAGGPVPGWVPTASTWCSGRGPRHGTALSASTPLWKEAPALTKVMR